MSPPGSDRRVLQRPRRSSYQRRITPNINRTPSADRRCQPRADTPLPKIPSQFSPPADHGGRSCFLPLGPLIPDGETTPDRGGTMTPRVAVPLLCLLVWIGVLACSDGIMPTDPATASFTAGGRAA